MTGIEWYESLQKPAWAPDLETNDLVWRILIQVILISFGFVFLLAIRKELPWSAAKPFVMNLVANLLFTGLLFDLRSLPLATIDALVVWVTIPWMMAAIWKHHKWVAFAQVPYFVWVSVTLVLQINLVWMNS